MKRINAAIDATIFYLLAAAFGTLVGVCLLQVVARYLFSASFAWAEEVSITILMWATWAAACLAVKHGGHLRVTMLEERISERKGLIIRVTLGLLAILFLVVVAKSSKTIIGAMGYQTMTSLQSVPITVMYYSVPWGCVTMVYYLLRSMIADINRLVSLTHVGR
jgi:TRAP-type transport system small permease protein